MSFPHNNDPIVLNDVIYCFLYRRFIVPFTIQEIQKEKEETMVLIRDENPSFASTCYQARKRVATNTDMR